MIFLRAFAMQRQQAMCPDASHASRVARCASCARAITSREPIQARALDARWRAGVALPTAVDNPGVLTLTVGVTAMRVAFDRARVIAYAEHAMLTQNDAWSSTSST
jgi:hypothetical protein